MWQFIAVACAVIGAILMVAAVGLMDHEACRPKEK